MAWDFTASGHNLDNRAVNLRGTVGTIACWVKPHWSSGDGNFHWFYELGDSINERFPYFRYAFNNTLIAGFLSVGEVSIGDATGLFTSGSWNHWLLTWDTTVRVELWRDGVSLGANTGPNVPAAQPGITIGNVQPSHSAQNANCLITEWGMWNRVLNSTEIANLAAKYWAFGAAPSGLAPYYKMKDDPGGGNPEPDEIGSDDLTVTGAAYSSDDPGIIYSTPGGGAKPALYYARMRR